MTTTMIKHGKNWNKKFATNANSFTNDMADVSSIDLTPSTKQFGGASNLIDYQ